MFCHICGKQLADDALFCDGCGAQQQAAPAKENANEQPVEAQIINEQVEEVASEEATQTTVVAPEPAPAVEAQPVVENEAPQFVPEQQFAPDFAAPVFEEPKKKKIWGKLIPAVIALALVAAIVLNLGTIIGFSIKTFGSDKAYFGYVEKKAFEGYSDDITNIYGSVVEALEFDTAAEGEVRLVLGDNLLQMAQTALGSMNLDWAKDISIAYDADMEGSAEAVELGIKLGDTEILALNIISDLVSGDVYLALADLNDKYLHISGNQVDLSTYEPSVSGAVPVPVAPASASVLGSIYGNENLAKALPDEDTVNELIDKYVEIVLDQLENVEKSSDTVKVSGIEQGCTKIEFKVTQEDLINIAVAVLEEAKNDGEIEDIIKEFVGFLNDEKLLEEDPSKVYEELIVNIEDAVESAKEAKAAMSGEELSRELISVNDYVNGSHEIIGRDLIVAGNKYVSYATAHDGSDFATEINIANMVSIKGSGNDKSDVVNGKFDLTAGGMDIADIEVVDFDKDVLDDEALNGTFRILINKQLLSGVDAGEYAALLSGLDGVEFKFDGDKDAMKADFNVIYNGKTLVGIATENETKGAGSVDLPDKKDIVEVTDEADLEAYLKSLDLDKLYDALEDADVPAELINLLKSALTSGMAQIGGSSAPAYNEY